MVYNSVRIAVLAFAISMAASKAIAQTGVADQPLPSDLREAARSSQAPGLVAAIIRDGKLTEVFTWGGAQCDGTGRADPRAAFEIGSISKQMTAAAALQLWERGQLNIDAPVGSYLSDIPKLWQAVTIRQLLTHTSGVPDYEDIGGYGIYETTPTPQQVYAIVATRPLDFEPGTNWRYSNTGYFLLSRVIEVVSGETFSAHMRTHLFARLRMRQTFLGQRAPKGVMRAQGCKPVGESGARATVRPISEESTMGAGGVYSTLADMAKWEFALRTDRVVSQQSLALMRSPVPHGRSGSVQFGMGMMMGDFRGAGWFGHDGQTQGFAADFESYPDRNTAIVVLANQHDSDLGQIMRGLRLRAMPDLSYNSIKTPADPDQQRTLAIRRALNQALLNEAPYDLLTDDMRDFATLPEFDALRVQNRDLVKAEAFEFLRESPHPDGALAALLYRTRSEGITGYITIGWKDGKLTGLGREKN